MKLTNAMREEFVDDVMCATKMKSKWDKTKMEAEINKRLEAATPKEILEFNKKWPGLLSRESHCVPFMRRRVSDGKRSWWEYGYAHSYRGIGLDNVDLTDLEKDWGAYLKELDEREEMRKRLMQIASEMTTDEQLLAALPKLAKFVPKPVVKVKAGLPVAMKGIQDELVKMGLEVSK